ncbi:MAG TPA: glycosyltransferase family 4 protein [Dongiaceae bacterium]|nr:glycosyltransferase family 4 protein [Dongiaceae bacterium]
MRRAREALAAAAPGRQARVLLVSLFHPELVRGGAQQVCYELFEGLKEQGAVRPFLLASVDGSHPALFKSGARITGFDGRPGEFLFLCRDYDYWWHKTGDPLLIEGYVDFLEQIRPDVVHFHHFLTFGIDILSLTRRTLPDARIILTLHEFLTICAADGHMVRKTDGSLCRSASQVRCHQCFPERSPEEFFLRELWMKRHLEAVDAFTCPTRFMMDHFIAWGLPREKLFHVTNGQKDYAAAGGASGRLPKTGERPNRFGFFGQLVDVKGIRVLLKAVEILRAEGFTGLSVEINGGNLNYASEAGRRDFEAFLEAEASLPPAERILAYNGPYDVKDLRHRMARIDWCIVPSVWWEIFGLVISEAWMFGRPVICSNVGAMAERVTHEVDGLHFEMGDAASLARTMKRAATEEGLWERLAGDLSIPPTREHMTKKYSVLYQDSRRRAA